MTQRKNFWFKIAALSPLLLILMSAGECRAFWLWPDGISSQWTNKPVSVDGGDAKWFNAEETYEPGIDMRAMNDANDVYLGVVADGMDGRALLSGAYRQNVTLWFLGPDGKAKDWGITIPFGSLEAPSAPFYSKDTPVMPKIVPEMILSQGAVVSTAAVPADIAIALVVSGKDPVIEVGIPLQRLRLKKGKFLLFDLITSPVSSEIKRRFSFSPAQSGGRGMGHGGGHRRSSESPESQGVNFPDPLNLQLSVQLARQP